LLICLSCAFANAQPLPAGKWRLKDYRSGGAVERPLKGLDATLNIHADGKFGGNSGCNVYGGSYTTDNDKLKIADITSTMRACEEPTPAFEKTYFDLLENAVHAQLKDGELVITDADSSHLLRFVRVQK